MSRPRDTQRRRVYNLDTRLELLLERKGVQVRWPGDPAAHLTFCGILVQRLWEEQSERDEAGELLLPPPQVTDGGRHRNASATRSEVIRLPKGYRDPLTVVHEVAHCLIWQRYRLAAAGHGRQYVALYCELVHLYLGGTRVEIQECRLKAKVKAN